MNIKKNNYNFFKKNNIDKLNKFNFFNKKNELKSNNINKNFNKNILIKNNILDLAKTRTTSDRNIWPGYSASPHKDISSKKFSKYPYVYHTFTIGDMLKKKSDDKFLKKFIDEDNAEDVTENFTGDK